MTMARANQFWDIHPQSEITKNLGFTRLTKWNVRRFLVHNGFATVHEVVFKDPQTIGGSRVRWSICTALILEYGNVVVLQEIISKSSKCEPARINYEWVSSNKSTVHEDLFNIGLVVEANISSQTAR